MVDIFTDKKGRIYTITGREQLQDSDEPAETALTAFLIIMEWADGGHLSDDYREKVILSGRTLSYLDHFIDICSALSTAHEKGIVHLDIKPQNLFYFQQG